jgi:hypothetical protein
MRPLNLLLFTLFAVWTAGCDREVIIEKRVFVEDNRSVNRLKSEIREYRNSEIEREVDQLFLDKYFVYYEDGTLQQAQKSFVDSTFKDKSRALRIDKVNPFGGYNQWYIAKIQERTSLYREWYNRALDEKLFNKPDREELNSYFSKKNLQKATELKRLAIAITFGNFYLDLNSSSYSESREGLYVDLHSDTTRFQKRIHIPMDNRTFMDLNSSSIKLSVEWGVSVDMKSLDGIDLYIDGVHHRGEPIGSRIYKIDL